MTLTSDQRNALEQGQPLRAVDAETNIECVVISSALYERVRRLLSDLDPRETYAAVDEVMREDWNDPKMAEYDDYEAHRP